MSPPSSMAVHECVQGAIDAILRKAETVPQKKTPCVVAFDVETTGFRGAVVQVGLVEVYNDGTLGRIVSGILRPPEGIEMEAGALAVHGIDEGRLARDAEPAQPLLMRAVAFLKDTHAKGVPIVAHNATFDRGRMNYTLLMHDLPELDVPIQCTMRGATPWCGLKNIKGAKRGPKNEELYHILMGRTAQADFGNGLHDAVVDATVTGMSYVEGKRRGWW